MASSSSVQPFNGVLAALAAGEPALVACFAEVGRNGVGAASSAGATWDADVGKGGVVEEDGERARGGRTGVTGKPEAICNFARVFPVDCAVVECGPGVLGDEPEEVDDDAETFTVEGNTGVGPDDTGEDVE